MPRMLSTVAAAAVVLLGAASSANAYSILNLRDFTNSISISCDNSTGAGVLACTGLGFATALNSTSITFSGIVGDFNIGFTNGINNLPGGTTLAFSNTGSTQVSRIGGVGNETFIVDFTSVGFTSPLGVQKTLEGSSTTNAFAGGYALTDTIQTFFAVNSANGSSFAAPAAPDAVTSINCMMSPAQNNPAPNTGGCNAGTVAWTDPVLGVAGFSTRTQQVFTIAAASFINSTSALSITNVPEPMSISLVGAALLGMGVATRRRRVAASEA